MLQCILGDSLKDKVRNQVTSKSLSDILLTTEIRQAKLRSCNENKSPDNWGQREKEMGMQDTTRPEISPIEERRQKTSGEEPFPMGE